MIRKCTIFCLATLLIASFALNSMPEWKDLVNGVNIRVSSGTSNSSNSSRPQTSFDSKAVSFSVIDGEYVLCSVGCSECSNGACTECLTGYTFISANSRCIKCGPNCKNCTDSNPN